jgi:hypothetical protein
MNVPGVKSNRKASNGLDKATDIVRATRHEVRQSQYTTIYQRHIPGLNHVSQNAKISTYGVRRFHGSRSEWDRVFSRPTIVPGKVLGIVPPSLFFSSFVVLHFVPLQLHACVRACVRDDAGCAHFVPGSGLFLVHDLHVILCLCMIDRSSDETIDIHRGSKEELVGYIGKESIQPQVPLRLPCYDFTSVTDSTVIVSMIKDAKNMLRT